MICIQKKYFKTIPGLARPHNSEAAKYSPRAMCKITNIFEPNHQQMDLKV